MIRAVCNSLNELLIFCSPHADEGILPDDDPTTLSFGWYFVESDLSYQISMSVLRHDVAMSPWIQKSPERLEKFLRLFNPSTRIETFQEILREMNGEALSLCNHQWVTTIRVLESDGKWTTNKEKQCKRCKAKFMIS
jgi:hypothetical protein